ncbi:MAG: hypothetical protein ABJE10_21870 [bacterium]
MMYGKHDIGEKLLQAMATTSWPVRTTREYRQQARFSNTGADALRLLDLDPPIPEAVSR